MGKAGGNLNQGVRKINEIAIIAGEAASRDRLAELLEEAVDLLSLGIEEHRECLAGMMRALGMRPDDDY